MSKTHILIGALLFSLLAVITSLVLLVTFIGPPSSSTLNELKLEGDELVKQIEEFKNANRKYPETLIQGGVEISEFRYGGWKYNLENGSRNFFLSIGKYENDLFVLYWTSKTGEWYLDT